MAHYGPPPIGYQRVKGRLKPHPGEAESIYLVFRTVADGASAREAAALLGWNREQARKVLHRREYAYGAAPLVSEALWREAHATLAANRPRPKRTKGPRP